MPYFFLLFVLIFLFLGTGEKTVLEENQIESAHGDAAVREVEDRGEEQKAVASHKWNPFRPDCVYHRKIKHVNNVSEHQRSIAENHTVEKTVDDVAESTGRYQCQANQHSGRNNRLTVREKSQGAFIILGLPHKRGDPPAKHTGEDYPEKRQQELSDCPSEFHPESHSLILDEENLKPISDDVEMFTQLHVRLDQNLDDLVNDDKYDSKNQETLTLRNSHLH